MTASPRILLSGYFGCGNAGDEAILAAQVGTLRRLRPTATLVALSADPEATATALGIESVPRFSLRDVRRELARAQLLISGGGSLIQDVTSLRSPLYYLGLMLMARRSGVPVAALCQGIGPVRRRWLRWLTGRVFRALQAISVRDEASAAALAEFGVPASSIDLAADAVWLLDPAPEGEIGRLAAVERFPASGPVIGVFPRPLPGQTAERSAALWDAIAGDLRRFLEQHGGHAVIVPMQRPGDAAAGEEIIRRVGESRAQRITGSYRPEELLGLTGRFLLAVGLRLHGLIFAARMGVPPVGISYDPKVAALLSQAGLQPALQAHSPAPGALLSALEETWQQRESLHWRLSALREENRRKAQAAVEKAVALIPSG